MPRHSYPTLAKDPDTLQRSVQALTTLGDQYFLPEALELLRRTSRKEHLTDDEVLLLAITAIQAARAHLVETGNGSQNETLNIIADILDHQEVIRAEYNKIYSLFQDRPAPREHGSGNGHAAWES
jgi:hypothetical protein